MSNFKIGNVQSGRDTNIQQAKGDIVGGINTTTAPTTPMGFKDTQDKQAFLVEIEKLHNTLRCIRAEIEQIPGLNQDAIDDIVFKISQQIKALKEAKAEAEKLPATPEVSTAKHKTLMDYLTSTEKVLNQAKALGEQAAEWTVKLAPYFEKACDLLTLVRRLFGMP